MELVEVVGIMKRLLFILLAAVFLAACGSNASVEPDYTTEEFEASLNDGDDLTGKTVSVEVKELVPDSAFGYNIQTGEHLNFVSSKNPNVEVGDEIIVEVEEIESMLGSYIITYKKK